MHIVKIMRLALLAGLSACSEAPQNMVEGYTADCKAAQKAGISLFNSVDCACFGRLLDPVRKVNVADRIQGLFDNGRWLESAHLNADITPAIQSYLYNLLRNHDLDRAGAAVIRIGYGLEETQRAEAAMSQSLQACRI